MKNRLRYLLTLILLSQVPPGIAGELHEVIFKDSFERCESNLPLPPGTVSWDGGGDGFSWNDPLNWSGDVTPADGDNIVIDRIDELITVVFNGQPETTQVNNLRSCESLSITGGTLQINGLADIFRETMLSSSGTLLIAGHMHSSEIVQSGGTVDGHGTLQVLGKYVWSNGTQKGSGETMIWGGIDIQGTSVKQLTARTLTLTGDSSWSGTGEIYLRDGATINNNGSFDIQNDEVMRHLGGVSLTINNTSTITKSAGSGLTELMAQVNNSGTMVVSQGELRLGRSAVTATSGGSFEAASGALLSLSGIHNMTGASFSGDGGLTYLGGSTTSINGSYSMGGPLRVQSGTLTISTAVDLTDDVTVSGGTLGFAASSSSITGDVFITNGTLDTSVALQVTGALTQSGGNLTGTGTMTMSDKVTWTSGTQSGSGETVADDGIDIQGTSVKQLTARTLTLTGDSSWSGTGEIYLRDGATINNNGPFDIQNDEVMRHISGVKTTLNNTSTITKSAGGGLSDIQATFSNTGTVNVLSGTLKIDGVDYVP